jgi:hypothetical protein
MASARLRAGPSTPYHVARLLDNAAASVSGHCQRSSRDARQPPGAVAGASMAAHTFDLSQADAHAAYYPDDVAAPASGRRKSFFDNWRRPGSALGGSGAVSSQLTLSVEAQHTTAYLGVLDGAATHANGPPLTQLRQVATTWYCRCRFRYWVRHRALSVKAKQVAACSALDR